MVSAWWLLLAFVVGGYVGMLLMALLVVSRDSDPESGSGRHRPGRTVEPDPRKIAPKDDWVI